MFELLMSADMMVPDPDGMTEMLVDKLGIYKHERWRQAFDNHPYIAHFLRVHKSLAVSPTRIEPQWHLDRPNPGDPLFHDFLESLKDFQGHHRPMITRSIVLALHGDKFDALVDKLMRRRLPFRMAQRTPEMPFDRLWLGATPEQPYYQPTVDGGLCIEIMPTEPLQMPPETYQLPPMQPRDLKPGDMVRVTARGFLVRDLDETLRKVSINLDWEPAGRSRASAAKVTAVRVWVSPCRTVPLSMCSKRPTGTPTPATTSITGGQVPYYIRIGVNDLAAKAEDLRSRGTRFQWIESSEAVGGRALIKIDPQELNGQVFEFEECPV